MDKTNRVFESKEAFEYLRCQDTERIVTDLAISSDPEEISAVAIYLRGSSRWLEFVRYVIGLETVWTYPRPSDAIRKLLDDETLRILLPEIPEAVAKALGQTGVDEYWTKKIRYFIANNDLERAWDEIIKAYRGILYIDGGFKFQHFQAGTMALASMALELAQAVGNEKLSAVIWKKTSALSHSEKLESKFWKELPKAADSELAFARQVWTTFNSLRHYFGEKMADRRKNRKERKLREYEAGH